MEGPERDIVGPVLPRLHSQMTAVVAGHPDLGLAPEQRPGVRDRAVALPEMNTVRTCLCGKVGAIIDDERHAIGLADRFQCGSSAQHLEIRDILQPELKRRHRSTVERGFQLFRKPRVIGRWRNQVELTRRTAIPREPVPETGVQRDEIVVHPRLFLALVDAHQLVEHGKRLVARALEGIATND